MGFWSWGSNPSDVEVASRVITATAGDRVTVRGKLVVHFAQGMTQADADAAADACAFVATSVMRESPSHVPLIGGEAEVVSAVAARMPADFAPVRTLELVSLHVVGNVGSPAVRRPSSGAVAAVTNQSWRAPTPSPSSAPPGPGGAPATLSPLPGWEVGMAPILSPVPAAPPAASAPPRAGGTPLPGAASHLGGYAERTSPIPGVPPPRESGTGPTPSGAPGTGRMPTPNELGGRRVSSSRMRAVTPFFVPPNAPPAVVGPVMAPMVRDSAARILIGVLRAHDLLVLRGIALDESSPEVMSALVPLSDAPRGGFEQSRLREIARWQGVLGPPIFHQLQREAAVFAVYLTYATLIETGISQERVLETVEAICASAYPHAESPVADLGRYLHAEESSVSEQLSAGMIAILGDDQRGERRASMGRAITPLIASVREEMSFAASMLKGADLP